MRLFLAIELDELVRRELARLQETLALGCRGWRWIDPQQIHLTLARALHGGCARMTDSIATPVLRSWDADFMTLFQSRTDPRGARYTALERFPFDGSAC